MKLKLEPSPLNPNCQEQSDAAFSDGGIWEQNEGRRQTRLFAEFFHRHVRVPFSGSFSVLDVGCALGDALPVWREHYPEARLAGLDHSPVGIERCREKYGHLAEFLRGSIEEIEGKWDVIYCSNVLEHFEQHAELAKVLLGRCRILYVMTPYRELRGGSPLKPESGQFHVATFDRNTFDSVGTGARIKTRIVRCPGAWGPDWTLARFLWARFKRQVRNSLLSPELPVVENYRQIIYEIEAGR